MAYKIATPKCLSCHTCMAVCPMGAIVIGPEGKPAIDSTKCASCGTCASVCPIGAIVSE